MTQNSQKKRAFILSGGAARGAFHLGILHFCEEHNIQIDTYSGSSIGAIISVAHASGISAKEQLKIFSSKDIKKVLKFNYFKNGLIRIDKNHKILNELLPIKKLEDLEKKVYVNAYDVKKKQLHYFDSGDTHTLCMASSALIPVFKPIAYENMYLIDGGLVDNIPIRPFLESNEEFETYSIDIMPRKIHTMEKRRNINPINILKKKVFARRMDNANYSIQHTNHYISNQKIRNFKMFTFNELNECFSFGYKEAQKHF